jgi:hypothetical protein
VLFCLCWVTKLCVCLLSHPSHWVCLRFHLFLECRLLKLDRNYFNARAMLAVARHQGRQRSSYARHQGRQLLSPQDHQCLPPINSPDLTTDHERLIICKKDRGEQSWKAAPGLPQTWGFWSGTETSTPNLPPIFLQVSSRGRVLQNTAIMKFISSFL